MSLGEAVREGAPASRRVAAQEVGAPSAIDLTTP
jgi:hypothetical protein